MKKKFIPIIIASFSLTMFVSCRINSDEAEVAEEVVVEEIDATVSEADATTKESYTITFIDDITDETFKEIEVEAGGSVDELPEAPEHDGYKFTEYDGNYSNVASDEIVVALYEEVADDTATNSEDASSDNSNKKDSNSSSSGGIFDDIDFSATVEGESISESEISNGPNSAEEQAAIDQYLRDKGYDLDHIEVE